MLPDTRSWAFAGACNFVFTSLSLPPSLFVASSTWPLPPTQLLFCSKATVIWDPLTYSGLQGDKVIAPPPPWNHTPVST